MGSPEPIDGRCNAKTRDDGYCTKYPAKEDGEVINGRCYLHGGHPDSGTKKGEAKALKHGLYSDRSTYYQNLDYDEQAWVDEMIDGLVEKAPFDEDDLGEMEILRQTVIDMHILRNTNAYIQQNGIAQTKIIDTDDKGDPVEAEVENILNLPKDRLQRSVTKRLKELGILDDPDSQQAEATKNLAEVLSGSD